MTSTRNTEGNTMKTQERYNAYEEFMRRGERETRRMHAECLAKYVQMRRPSGYAERPKPNFIPDSENKAPILMEVKSIAEIKRWQLGDRLVDKFIAYTNYPGRCKAEGFTLSPALPSWEIVGNSLNVWCGYTAEPVKNSKALDKFRELWDKVFPGTDYMCTGLDGVEYRWTRTSDLIIDILRAIDRGANPQLQLRALGPQGCGKTTAISSLKWLCGYHYYEGNGGRAETAGAVIHFEDNGRRVKAKDNPGIVITATSDLQELKSDVGDLLLHGRVDQTGADPIVKWAIEATLKEKLKVAAALLYVIRKGAYINGTVFVGRGPRTGKAAAIDEGKPHSYPTKPPTNLRVRPRNTQ